MPYAANGLHGCGEVDDDLLNAGRHVSNYGGHHEGGHHEGGHHEGGHHEGGSHGGERHQADNERVCLEKSDVLARLTAISNEVRQFRKMVELL
jgi:hypothetical protein